MIFRRNAALVQQPVCRVAVRSNSALVCVMLRVDNNISYVYLCVKKHIADLQSLDVVIIDRRDNGQFADVVVIH